MPARRATSKPAPAKPSGLAFAARQDPPASPPAEEPPPFIIDNKESWKAARYIRDLCEISKSIDIATGNFEVGGLLALEDKWQLLDSMRVLMGTDTTTRTAAILREALTQSAASQLDASLESAKLENDFLEGVPAIKDAIAAKKIALKVYTNGKFHAKAYITHSRVTAAGSHALVGSSNFTKPGLSSNFELNLRLSGAEVTLLQQWYERRWEEAEDISLDLLNVIEHHIRDYDPFPVYARALIELLGGAPATASDWERTGSSIYPRLRAYQREAYHSLLAISKRWNGAFLCDGVGTGKTFVGLMLMERFTSGEAAINESSKNVVLFAPKTALEDVWKPHIKRNLPSLEGEFVNLACFAHSDLTPGSSKAARLRSVLSRAHVVIVDEAHHFRNAGVRYDELQKIIGEKTTFLLTATPINNRVVDFRNQVQLFARNRPDYLNRQPLQIPNLTHHFKMMEQRINAAAEASKAQSTSSTQQRLWPEDAVESQVFSELVVQRSRAYIKASVVQEGGGKMLFPKPADPGVQPYSCKKTYGRILDMIEAEWKTDEPLFTLAAYNPYNPGYKFFLGDRDILDKMDVGRDQQVVALIRTLFLKRFESSIEAFRATCQSLAARLRDWVDAHATLPAERKKYDDWMLENSQLLEKSENLFDAQSGEEDEEPREATRVLEKRSREEFDVTALIDSTLKDLDSLARYLRELTKLTNPKHDDKLKALLKLLGELDGLKASKLLIFTEFKTTAKYLETQLKAAPSMKGTSIARVDSSTPHRSHVIKRFAPYYNESTSARIAAENADKHDGKQPEIDILVSTDVLSEGLNLQDATRLINYDLHWNPVRLMQRIGRIDRRLSEATEKAITADHPDRAPFRSTIAFWNFLPPDELERLLGLYERVTDKTYRISETLGIEGGKLLTARDVYKDLKTFVKIMDGEKSPLEELRLTLARLRAEHPTLDQDTAKLPSRLFSGKAHLKPGSRAAFFCVRLPWVEGAAPPPMAAPAPTPHLDTLKGDLLSAAPEPPQPKPLAPQVWTLDDGPVHWFLYDIANGKVSELPTEEVSAVEKAIRSAPNPGGTPRKVSGERELLKDARRAVLRHVESTFLKKLGYPKMDPSVPRPEIRCWMELC